MGILFYNRTLKQILITNMININAKTKESVVIPLSGIKTGNDLTFEKSQVILEKLVGGQKYQFDCVVAIDKCEQIAVVGMDRLPKEVKEGGYRMKIYLKEIDKLHLTLANIKYGNSNRFTK